MIGTYSYPAKVTGYSETREVTRIYLMMLRSNTQVDTTSRRIFDPPVQTFSRSGVVETTTFTVTLKIGQ